MSDLLGDPSGRSGAGHSAPPSQSPASAGSRPSGLVELRLKDAGSLFDDGDAQKYPNTGPALRSSVASYLLQSAREQRAAPSIEIVVGLTSPPMTPAEETVVRTHISNFFTAEHHLAELDRRVNRTEGLASLRYALPVVLVAVLIIGIVYTEVGTASAEGYVIALIYLFFVIVVWVMLWDPIEVLLFNSFMLRLKIGALRKLAVANVRFVYSQPELPPAGAIPHGPQDLSAASNRLP